MARNARILTLVAPPGKIPPVGPSRSNRRGGSLARFALSLFFLSASSSAARARPGEGHWLAGMEAQGPASSHLSAVFHNPAMLTALPGLHLQLSGVGQLGVQRIAPAQLDAQSRPIPGVYQPTGVYRNLGGDVFFAASFLFENFAVAASYYTLDSKFRERAPHSLSAFVRPNPSPYCRMSGGQNCSPSAAYSGWAELRSEFTLALAWQSIRRLRLGLSIHFPRYSLRGSRVRNPQTEAHAGLCEGLMPGDPNCVEVERLRFRSRWRGKDPSAARFQIAMTAGIAWQPSPRWTLGARLRFRPNFGMRAPVYQGELNSCADGPAGPRCDSPLGDAAQLRDEPGRQVALGLSFRPFGDGLLHLDGQLYWIQHCPDERTQGLCRNAGTHMSRLAAGPGNLSIRERPWYRGLQDRFGAELWLQRSLQHSRRPRLRRLAYSAGIGGYSAAVRPAAHNPVDNDASSWFGAGSVSLELLRRKASLFVIGGYAFIWQRSRRVGSPQLPPSFEADAFARFEQEGAGIDDPAGQAMRSGRARSSNAGIYRALGQRLSLSLRWGARP